MTGPLDVAEALAQAVRELTGPQDLERSLERVVRVARDSVPGIDHVGITMSHHDGRFETLAASDPMVLELDKLQYESGQGPCLHAIDADATVRVEHARHEQRWPLFIPAAVALGLRSQLGVRLHVDTQTLGALNMYSFSSDTLSAEVEQMGDLFATHIGLVLGHARSIENLNAALASRKTIGLALGMLMQRLGVDEDTAFAYLTRMSASSETKLRDVATAIVEQHGTRHHDASPSAPL